MKHSRSKPHIYKSEPHIGIRIAKFNTGLNSKITKFGVTGSCSDEPVINSILGRKSLKVVTLPKFNLPK